VDFLSAVEEISMEDVRRLIRRLIDAGYELRVPTSHTEQEIRAMHETTVKQVDLVRELRADLAGGAEVLREEARLMRRELKLILDDLLPVCRAIDSHPVNQSRNSLEEGAASPFKRGSFFEPDSSSPTGLRRASVASQQTASGLENDMLSLIRRDQKVDRGQHGEEREEDQPALDSDEEAQLHAELDALIEMQERVEAMGGNQNKYMASVFQRACLQITEIESMYADLAAIFSFAAGRNDVESVPTVDLREFAIALDVLRLSAISQSDVEEMFESGLRYISFKRGAIKAASAGLDTSLHSVQSDLPADRDLDLEADEPADEDARVSMTTLIAGSASLRARLVSLQVDEVFCCVSEAPALRRLREVELRLLAGGARMRKVAKGEIFLKEPERRLRSQPRYAPQGAMAAGGQEVNRVGALSAARAACGAPFCGAPFDGRERSARGSSWSLAVWWWRTTLNISRRGCTPSLGPAACSGATPR
jgi:hypothetical protein